MHRYALTLIFSFFALGCCPLNAMFMMHETQKVPVARLLENLHKKQAKNTNDFEVTYQLARIHSMAYATNLTEIQVTKKQAAPVFGYPGSDSGVPSVVQVFKTPQLRQAAMKELTNAIALYERALVLLKRSTNQDEARWMILPTQLGLAWCLDQSGHRDRALDAYRRTLATAWQMEVIGDFTFKAWAEGVWNDVRAARNPLHGQRRGHLGPGVCYSEEVIGYLLQLLDAKRDAKEIADLQRRKATLAKMPRAITPIVIPLQDGLSLREVFDENAGVAFDLDGSGVLRSWGWIKPTAAWLVHDPSHSEQITSALQMFGNVSFWVFWRDGFAALAALDDDGDGALTGAELDGLALWCDANSNGVSEPGEVRGVADAGITRIDCCGEALSQGLKWNPCGVSFRDGSTRPSYDWISESKPISP